MCVFYLSNYSLFNLYSKSDMNKNMFMIKYSLEQRCEVLAWSF